MATIDDLPRLVSENPQIREDLLATLASFFERHGIAISAEDVIGEDSDVKGYIISGLNAGSTIPSGLSNPGGTVGVFIYRDGPNYSRLIDSGIVSPGSLRGQ